MLTLRQGLFGGIAAGVMVGIGGAVFMSCDNRYVGAVMFAVALLSICMLKMYLFTGKVGFFAERRSETNSKNILLLLCGLAGNFIGATVCGLLLGLVKNDLYIKAGTACAARISRAMPENLFLGVMCGILMYVSVKIYVAKDSVWGILFCIPVFILCGFEHSIADMFYFALGRAFSLDYLVFILTIIAGNTIGGMLMPVLVRLAGNGGTNGKS